MAVFSTNQNRQFYVATKVANAIDENSQKGTIGGVVIGGDAYHGPEFAFTYKGADTVLRSDLIQLRNLIYARIIDAHEMRVPFKTKLVSLDTNVNEGKVVAGQQYVLRLEIRQWIASGEDNVYFKDGAILATKAMEDNSKLFYDKMVESLNLGFSREIGATKTANPYLKFESTNNGILITEKEQSWSLGIGAQEQVNFEVVPTTVYVAGVEEQWGKVEDKTPTNKDSLVVTGANATGVGNGKKIADMEWFYMGERGDQYRMAGYPNYIPTEYLVDPSKEYHVLELHYSFTDTGVNSYQSEKDITIVATDKSILRNLLTMLDIQAQETPSLIEEQPEEDPDEPDTPPSE